MRDPILVWHHNVSGKEHWYVTVPGSPRPYGDLVISGLATKADAISTAAIKRAERLRMGHDQPVDVIETLREPSGELECLAVNGWDGSACHTAPVGVRPLSEGE
jgi:hypothetical protein